MKLKEAIAELTEITNYTTHRPSPTKVEAIKLGIEALKRELSWRKVRRIETPGLLPGETEE